MVIIENSHLDATLRMEVIRVYGEQLSDCVSKEMCTPSGTAKQIQQYLSMVVVSRGYNCTPPGLLPCTLLIVTISQGFVLQGQRLALTTVMDMMVDTVRPRPTVLTPMSLR